LAGVQLYGANYFKLAVGSGGNSGSTSHRVVDPNTRAPFYSYVLLALLTVAGMGLGNEVRLMSLIFCLFDIVTKNFLCRA